MDKKWKFWEVLLISLGIGGVFLAGFFSLRWIGIAFIGLQPGENPGLFFTVLLACLEVFAILAGVYLFGLWRQGKTWADVGLIGPSKAWLVGGVLLGGIAIPTSGLIALLIQWLLGLPLSNPQLDFLAPEGFSWTGAIAMFVLGGLLVPLAEEVYFRGLLYQWLRGWLGPLAGAIISAAIFGALHGEISVAGAAFVLGLLLAWVYERSQSLWPAVIIHVINNGVKIIILYTLLASGVPIAG